MATRNPRRTPRTRPAEAGPVADPGEAAFLEAYDPGRYERPSVAVDVVLLTAEEDALRTLLVRREGHPHQGRWALPGVFVGLQEPLEAAAARALREKAGLTGLFLEQLYTFGDPRRDPRTRVLSVAHVALVDGARFRAAGAAAGERGLAVGELEVPWEGETGGPVEVRAAGKPLPLAFDHAEILGMAVKRLRGKLDYTPIGFQLLPETFTLLELQRVHETVLGRPVNKDSFRRRMLASGQLEATGESQTGVGHRPAELYRFARRSAL
ncbi:MAG: NUDIX domain-containing protein [Anaeromyxobacter sp.]